VTKSNDNLEFDNEINITIYSAVNSRLR